VLYDMAAVVARTPKRVKPAVRVLSLPMTHLSECWLIFA
jgi:hypothetical protein